MPKESLFCFTQENADELDFAHLIDAFPKSAFEVRLDAPFLEKDDEYRRIFNRKRRSHRIVAVLRDISDIEKATRLFSKAIQSGTDFVEIPMEMPEAARAWLISLALQYPCKLILSRTLNFGTPPPETLRRMADEAYAAGADIFKITARTETEEEAGTISALYDQYPHEALIAYGLGENGYFSRWHSLMCNAPLFYLARSRDTVTEECQPTYFNTVQSVALQGEVQLPSDAVQTVVSIFLAALCKGRTTIYGVTPCGETDDAMAFARALGADVSVIDGRIVIEGTGAVGPDGEINLGTDTLYAGESETLTALCLTLAAVCDGDMVVTGRSKAHWSEDFSYKMGRIFSILGVKMEFISGKHRLPVRISGKSEIPEFDASEDYEISLYTLLIPVFAFCKGERRFRFPVSYNNGLLHRIVETCRAFGLSVTLDKDEGEVFLTGNSIPKAIHGIKVGRDFTIAAMWAAAGMLCGDITLKDFRQEVSYPSYNDFLEIIKLLRCDIEFEGDDLNCRKSFIPLLSTDIHGYPELGPVLALLAQGAVEEWIIEDYLFGESPTLDAAISRIPDLEGFHPNAGEHDLAIGHVRFSYRVNCLKNPYLAILSELIGVAGKKRITVYGKSCLNRIYPEFYDVLKSLSKVR